MNELVLRNEKGQIVTTSLLVSSKFHKRHDNVLRDIDKLPCSEEFNLLNFEETPYKDAQGREQRMVSMTKNGFITLVAKYHTREAGAIVERWLEAFDAVVDLAVKQNDNLNDYNFIMNRALEMTVQRMKEIESNLKKRTEQLAIADKKVETATKRLEAVAPKVEFTDRVRGIDKLFQIGKVAKILQLPFGRNKFFEKLREEKILMANNEPFQSYIDQGFLVYKLRHEIECTNQETKEEFTVLNYQTFATGNGMYWLSKKYDGKNPLYRKNANSLPSLF